MIFKNKYNSKLIKKNKDSYTNKYFQVFEKFWKKRLLRQSWFLQIRK